MPSKSNRKKFDDDDNEEFSTHKKNSSKRPIWFILAYISVAITIICILLIVIAFIVIILKNVRFSNKWTNQDMDQEYSYFGGKISKSSGYIILGVALIMAILGWFLFQKSLQGIDKYIMSMQDELDNERLQHKTKALEDEQSAFLQ